MGMRTTRLRYTAVGMLLIGLILAAWELSVRMDWVSQLALPLPTSVLQRGTELALTAQFWSNWGRTLAVWITAFAAGTAAGLSLGFAAGVSDRMWQVLLPLLSYLRAIPPIALFPIALIAMGPGGLPIGIVAGLASALYVFPGTARPLARAHPGFGSSLPSCRRTRSSSSVISLRPELPFTHSYRAGYRPPLHSSSALQER